MKIKRSSTPRRQRRLASGTRLAWANDRGDIPGWVLITLMTAGLVVALWAVAAPALGNVFDQAIQRVVGF